MPIETILFSSFISAFIAFILASNIFNSFWKWLTSGIVVFITVALAMTFNLVFLYCIVIGIFVMLLIFLFFKRK
ncbi:MAG: hypothetical protein IKB02_05365 [Clostridia bacterium]|nr:hypothetical protein [Clostridia bacterium]